MTEVLKVLQTTEFEGCPGITWGLAICSCTTFGCLPGNGHSPFTLPKQVPGRLPGTIWYTLYIEKLTEIVKLSKTQGATSTSNFKTGDVDKEREKERKWGGVCSVCVHVCVCVCVCVCVRERERERVDSAMRCFSNWYRPYVHVYELLLLVTWLPANQMLYT